MNDPPPVDVRALRALSPPALRRLFREGRYTDSTAGLAPNYVQANLTFVPSTAADAFLKFCRLNAQACPLIEYLGAGQSEPRAALGANLYTDAPSYTLCEKNQQRFASEIPTAWRPNMSAFLLGCSFTAEAAVQHALSQSRERAFVFRHIEQGRNIAMYQTSVACRPVGCFAGTMVVSMRWIPRHDVEKASETMARYPWAHGAPIHVGDPLKLGISDLRTPDFGEYAEPHVGDVPVFSACGVTSTVALQQAGLALWAAHRPGAMFITDLPSRTGQHPPTVAPRVGENHVLIRNEQPWEQLSFNRLP